MGKTVSTLSESYVKQEDIPHENPTLRTIPHYIRHNAFQAPDKEAVVFISTDEKREAVTFKELYEKSEKVAHRLVSLGVKQHDVVSVNVRPCPEWLFIVFGAIMAGASPFAVSFTYKDGSDLIDLMERLKVCTCIFLDPGNGNENWSILAKLLDSYSDNGTVSSKRMPSLKYLICHDPSKTISGVKLFEELLTNVTMNSDMPEVHEDDIAILFQTSGSTGLPKAVAHTHTSMLDFIKFARGTVFSKDDKYFCDRPFGWIGGFPFSVFIGQTRVTMSGFCPPPTDRADFLIKVIVQENCHVFVGLPSTMHEVLKRKDRIQGNWPVKSILTGGQPITKHTMNCIGQVCQHVMAVYGGSEFMLASAMVVSDPNDFVDFSSGPIAAGLEVKVVDPDLNIVPIGTSGEIYLRSKGVFREYYNDPERTKTVLTDDRWYKTDDIGRMLNDGSLIVEGRKSNMILSGGMNVAPEILENLISRCPGVSAVVLVPIPDEILYQVICACVKVSPGSGVNEHVVRKFCEDSHGDSLGLFTVLPKFYLIVDTFPTTSTGKVSRKSLTAMACEAFRQ